MDSRETPSLLLYVTTPTHFHAGQVAHKPLPNCRLRDDPYNLRRPHVASNHPLPFYFRELQGGSPTLPQPSLQQRQKTNSATLLITPRHTQHRPDSSAPEPDRRQIEAYRSTAVLLPATKMLERIDRSSEQQPPRSAPNQLYSDSLYLSQGPHVSPVAPDPSSQGDRRRVHGRHRASPD